MAQITPTIPEVGLPHSTEDPKIRSALLTIRNAINGNLDSDNWVTGAIEAENLANSLAGPIGVNNGSNRGRATSAVATSQSTSSSSFTDLATAGPSITLDVPSNGFVLLYASVSMTPTSTGAAMVGVTEATDYGSGLLILVRAANTGAATQVTSPGGGGVVPPTPGGFILLPATAGARTYKLQYGRYLGSGSVTFASRSLWGIALGA